MLDILLLVANLIGMLVVFFGISWVFEQMSDKRRERLVRALQAEGRRYVELHTPNKDDQAKAKYQYYLDKYSTSYAANRIADFFWLVGNGIAWLIVAVMVVYAAAIFWFTYLEGWRTMYLLWGLPVLLLIMYINELILFSVCQLFTGRQLGEARCMRKLAHEGLERIEYAALARTKSRNRESL